MRLPLKFLFFISIIMSLSVKSKVIKFDISSPIAIEFNFHETCMEMGVIHPVLIEIKSPLALDCMGTEVDTTEFCLKKYKNRKDFLRGVVDEERKKVVCQFGKSAILSIGCERKFGKICQSAISGCSTLRNIFATNLQIVHKSLIRRDEQKVLTCYFGPKDQELLKFDL